MELKLAKDEKIVKSWDYAISGSGFSARKKIKSNLTLTNMRIIATQYNDVSLDRKEIPIKAVKNVQGSFQKNRSFWAYVKLILGIPLCIAIIGIFMIISAVKTLKGASLDLSLTTEGFEGSSLYLGAAGAMENKGFFGRLFSAFKPTVRVNVDKTIAKEILDEIGATIISVKNA